MIFPPDSVHEFRQELADKMDAGTLEPSEGYRQALTVDPNDPGSLRSLALISEDQGDRAAAADFARRAIRAHPLSHEGYLVLGRVLSDSALAAAYAALGKQKLHFDPEAEARMDPADLPAEPALPIGAPESGAVTLLLQAMIMSPAKPVMSAARLLSWNFCLTGIWFIFFLHE